MKYLIIVDDDWVPREADSEMEFSAQSVCWGGSSGSIPVEAGKGKRRAEREAMLQPSFAWAHEWF